VNRLLALLLAAVCAAAGAQVVPANVAVPYYTPPAFMKGVHRYWFAPRASEFAASAAALPAAMQQVCTSGTDALPGARSRWQAAAVAWDRLSAVAVGPLLARRSIRQIDFAPTRPELIARAIQAAPANLAAMEQVGTPAKGLPGLEWLLWTRPVSGDTPACRYAVLVAAAIDAEAQALDKAFGELAAKDWEAQDEAAVAAMGEVLNQWVGGIERLRWANLEKPLRSAGGKTPAFPRAASGTTRRSWAAQWQGLRALGAAADNRAPPPGEGLVPLETYLRGRGLNPLAGKVASATAQVSMQVEALAPADRKRALSTARSLAALKRLAETQVAPALEVSIGFSDADGD
jgi:predicted lipoprotein